MATFSRRSLRLWALTSTKYLLGNTFVMAKDMDVLLGTTNQFTVRERFDLVPIIGRTNGYTALVSEQGRMALLEFDGALPRAGLYENWRSGLTDDAVLLELPRAEWNPHREVLISEKIPAPESADANATVVPARYLSYDPKRIVLETDAETPRSSLALSSLRSSLVSPSPRRRDGDEDDDS